MPLPRRHAVGVRDSNGELKCAPGPKELNHPLGPFVVTFPCLVL